MALVALIIIGLLIAAQPRPGYALAGGEISGTVFFDSNGNGVFDAGEKGISDATLKLRDATDLVTAATLTDATGVYRFTGLAQGTYMVTQFNLPGYTSTTANTLSVIVGASPVTEINFGDVYPITLSGYVFWDVNGDGVLGLGEPKLSNAYVGVHLDINANGVLDPGEVRIAYRFTDAQGFYTIPGLMPGAYLILEQPPGGGRQAVALTLIAREVSGTEQRLDFAVQAPEEGAGLLTGIIWNDRDGDELLDADEPPFADAGVLLYNDIDGNGQVEEGETLAGKTATDAAGRYLISNLPAHAYVLRVDEGSLPGSYVASLDSSGLAFTLAAGEARRLDVGYYDPLAVAPLRVANWKRELKRTAGSLYTPAQLDQLVAGAETASAVFSEAVPLRTALLMPAKNPEEQARKEHAALRLNVASGRLLPRTPVNLPDLTVAQNVEGAVAEIEGWLWPASVQTTATYSRVKAIAEALNKGQGVGYGGQSVFQPGKAYYRGIDVTARLQAGGDSVDQYADQPLTISNWKIGKFDAGLNVFDPYLRLTVKAFYNGGVLEVRQALPNGQELSLGTAVPAAWNTDVNATFIFYLRNVTTTSDLTATQLRFYVRKPSEGGGPKEHVKVDAATLVFAY